MLWDANSEFADKLNGKLETLLQDAQKEYVRVQNLITFEKVRSQGNLTVLPSDLVLPPPPEASPVPFLAVKVLPSWDTNTMGAPDPQVPRGFRQAFEWFCKASLVIRPEVCAALQVTRGMCLDLLTEKVFETNFNTALRLQEFSERQEASIMRLKGRLGMWAAAARLRAEPQPPAQVKAMIEERKERIKQIQESIPDDKESITIGFYRRSPILTFSGVFLISLQLCIYPGIESGGIRNQLIEKLETSMQLLLKSLAETLEVNIHEATVAFEGIFTKLQTQVATIEECSDMKAQRGPL
eukprot:g9765.t1